MKKTICILLAVLACVALAIPAMGAASAFVPSITYKGYPTLLAAVDGEDADVLGCVTVLSVAQAKGMNTEEAKKLVEVYEALNDGSMTLPYDKVDGVKAEEMVIRELVDISLVCDHDHKLAVVILDLGVDADETVVCMSYVNGEWIPAEEIINNGDGTVTITFKQLCPVAIAVEG